MEVVKGVHTSTCAAATRIPKIQATRNSNPAFSQCCASFGNVGSTAVRYLLMLDGLSRLHRHRVNLEGRKVSHPSRARIFMQCITPLPVSVTFSLPSTADLLTHNVFHSSQVSFNGLPFFYFYQHFTFSHNELKTQFVPLDMKGCICYFDRYTISYPRVRYALHDACDIIIFYLRNIDLFMLHWLLCHQFHPVQKI